MKRFLPVKLYTILLFFFLSNAQAQTDQTYTNGTTTSPINFPGTGCTYNWTNSNPSIGLPASGIGNIPAFMPINTGTSPVTANITAIPAPSGFAYIENSSSNTVSVINLATNVVVKTIQVNVSPIGVAVSTDGSKVYVTNQGSSNITVISTSTNTVIATIACKPEPTSMVVSPDGSRLYVTNESSSNNLSVISTATNAVIANISVGNDPYGVAISPDGSKVYVTNAEDNTVSVINTSTNTVITNIPIGQGAMDLLTSPDGSRLYVLNAADNTMSIINTLDNTVITTIATGNAPFCLAMSADGSRLYVTNGNDNTVSVINTATNATIATIPVGNIPIGVSLSADGNYLYVVNLGSHSVSVINTVTNLVIGTVGVGLAPHSYGNFIKTGVSCGGKAVEFTITVKPASLVSPVIAATATTGTITTCQGVASTSSHVQQFTVSGTNLTDNITATAPAGFEIYLAGGSGWGSSVVINQTGGTISNAMLQVRASATATAGNISGNVVLSSGTTSKNIAVTGFVNKLPAVTQPASPTYTNGETTPPISFTGTATGYIWTNDTPAIGLPANGSGDISSFTAINAGTSPVKATITVTPLNTGYAYIANFNANTVSVINTASNIVVKTIPVGMAPVGVAVSPDEKTVYVGNANSDNISVINTATNTVTSTITTSKPLGIVLSANGSLLYAGNFDAGTVSVINTATGKPTATIAVGVNPVGMVISPDGSRLYVTNFGDGTLSVINTSTNLVVATLNIGLNCYGVAVSPDGSHVYVTNGNSNDIAVIDATINAVIAVIGVGLSPENITVSPDGSTVYVTNKTGGTVSVINTATNKVINTITVGSNPTGIEASADGTLLYVANQASNTVSVISATSFALVSTITVGDQPMSIGKFITNAGCSGNSVTFNITVNSIISGITATGTLSPLDTNYGTASSSTVFTVAGNALKTGILVTPPNGFEVSTDDIHFSNTITVGSVGSIAPTTVFIRLAATTPVNVYTGNIVLSSTGVGNVNVTMAKGTVSPDVLTITADNKSRTYGVNNPILTISYSGFVNNETAAQLIQQPLIRTTATSISPIGEYPITVSGAVSVNYTFVYVPGILSINPVGLVIPNAFTPNGDGINDTWNIKYIENYPNCKVDIYNRYGEKLYSSIGYPIPWDGKYKGAILPIGTYYYIINPEDGHTAIAGYIAIIR